jgi:hypothetical protein
MGPTAEDEEYFAYADRAVKYADHFLMKTHSATKTVHL